MSTLVKGIHHITQCPGPAQQDVDFCTQVLGQRLVKQTVLMDGSIPDISLLLRQRRRGAGLHRHVFSLQPQARARRVRSDLDPSYAIPRGAIAFWKEHVERHGVEHSGIQERFGADVSADTTSGRHVLRSGREPDDSRRPWATRRSALTWRRAASSAL